MRRTAVHSVDHIVGAVAHTEVQEAVVDIYPNFASSIAVVVALLRSMNSQLHRV